MFLVAEAMSKDMEEFIALLKESITFIDQS
jgi:hypothetical protein